ncbi:MAG: HYR domain-containing protein [Saprospirales bacterium]|nr:MAG: HYR domain-containing protein [Saprospirales bacterium]
MNRLVSNLLASLMLIAIGSGLLAQPADWVLPNPSAYNYSATVISKVLVDDERASSDDNVIAFFKAGELRGLGSPLQTDSGTVYYTTIYSNAPVDTLNADFYHNDSDQVLFTFKPFYFELYSTTGTLEDPYLFRTYSDNDAPVGISLIPDQLTLQGFPFPEIDLADFLLTLDDDPVVWIAGEHPDLSISIDGSLLQVSSDPNFTGTVNLQIAVEEQTANAKSDSTMVLFEVVPAYPAPQLGVVPGQGVLKGEEFVNLCDSSETVLRNLNDFQSQSDSCLFYSYLPVIEGQIPPDLTPDWQVSNSFRNSMNVVAEVFFTPEYQFLNEGDVLAAFVDGEVRGVTNPTKEGENYVFYLNVGGQSGDSEIELKFYSQEKGKVMSFPERLPFQPYGLIGSWESPHMLDISPLLPVISPEGEVEVQVRDTSWTGTQQFVFFARDCGFPEFLYDSTAISYCVVEDPSGLTYYYLIGDERGFDEQTLFTRSCSPPEGYVGILDFNCSHDVVIDAEQACAVPIPNLIMELDVVPNCQASEASGVQQIPSPNSSLIQIADTISVFLYRENQNGDNEVCSFDLILENFGEEVSLICPSIVEVNAVPGECDAFVELEVDFTQGCGPVSVENDYTNNGEDASDWYPIGSTEVNFELIENDTIADICTVEVVVQDVQLPSIDCPADLVVEVDEGHCVATEVEIGSAVAWLDCGTVDAQSNAPAEYEIGETEVQWIATGYNGKTSECIQTVTVEDLQPPVLVCPDDVTIDTDPGSCDATGFAPEGLSATAICGDVTLDYEVLAVLFHGENQISYTAVGANGVSSECTQLVTVEGEGDISIECPPDIEIILVEGNCELTGLDVGISSVIGNCNPVTVTSDAPSTFYPGQTLVTHTAEASGGSTYSCVQEIDLVDEESPVIECPVDTTISTDIGSCSAADPELEGATASMSCGAVSLSNNAPFVFSVGITEVTYTAVGYNEQTSECTYVVTVVDAEDPVIFCPDDVNLVIPFGHTESYVQLGISQALDNCGVDTIYNSYNDGGVNASGTYSLGDTTVVFTAEDAAGNSASCEVVVSITPAPQELDTFYISGQIATWAGYPVSGVELSVQGSSPSEFTNEYGDYELEVFENQSAVVTPKKNNEWLEGVSTIDLVMIQGHIIGLNALGNPYAIIAGDANKDGVVSTFDLILLQTLIIGVIDQIPGNSPWRFIPASYNFNNPADPMAESFPEVKVYPYINSDFTEEGWVAVKTGDASGDAAETGSRETRGHRTFNLFAEEDEHGYTTVRFFLPTMEPISGYQIEIFVDPLEFELISYSHAGSVLPNLSDINFFMDAENGILRSNWWYAPGKMPDREELLFEMRLRPLSENSDLTSAIGLNSRNPRFNSEVYDRKGRTKDAAVSWKYHRDTRGYSLFQNEPNPFSNATIIPFILPDDMPLQLNIFDAGGKLIESVNLDGTKGINYHPFNPTSPKPGLYYYQLQTGEWTGVKKMIRY